MSSKTRSFRVPRNPIGVLILLAAFAAAAGCSTPGDVVVNHVDASGNSVPGWVTPTGGAHANSATMNYIANGGSSSCTECHGSDLAGGISRVSCFGNTVNCHHGGPSAGWFADSPAVQNHGVSAKKAPGSSGFASCQICHGSDFSGGGAEVSCTNNPNASCHGPAVASPHPPDWLAGDTYIHSNTDPANAPVCYRCHSYTGTVNPNNPHVPPTPAPGGTAPGCFNGTMCHNKAGHPEGWVATPPAAQPHGVTAKKDGTVAGQGFPSCKTCHGNNFAGATVAPTCLNNATCHGAGVASPHAPKPWRGSPYTHTDTVEAGNVPVCYQCHAYTGTANPNNPHVPPTPAPGGTAPGCFNGTMCHNQAGHPAGWVATPPAAQPHGDSAKATPGATTGYASCQVCHGTGTNFLGGSSGISCYPCHVPTANSPHASQWRTGDTYVHTTTAEGNAAVCAFCHLNGANSPISPPSAPAPAGTAPGCFNSTLCHGATFHPTGWGQATQHGPVAKQAPSASGGFAFCQVCHGTGTNFSGGLTGTSCYTCHGVSAPHASQWRTGDTFVHTTTAGGNATVCAFCHRNGVNSPIAPPSPPAPDNTAPGCFNSTLCH